MDIVYLGVILAILAILVIFVVILWNSSTYNKLPPGPPHLPLVGSLPFMPGGDTCQVFARFRKKYGDLFTIYMGSSPVVVVSGYNNIKHLLLDKGTLTSYRPDTSFLSNHVQEGKGVGPKSGIPFKDHHTFLVKTLRHFAVGSDVMLNTINNEADCFIQEIKQRKGLAFNPMTLIRCTTYNIIMNILTGTRLEYDDKSGQKILERYDVIGDVKLTGPVALFPWLRYIPGDPFGYYQMKEVVAAIIANVQKHIKEHKKNTTQHVCSDYIYAYLDHLKKVDSSLGFSEDELAMGVLEMSGAASTTLVYSTMWALIILVRNPQIQEKIHKEITDFMERNRRLPTYEERIKETPYTTAFTDESLRYSDVIITTNVHQTSADIEFGGYILPKGISILPHVGSIHQDATLWSNPETVDVTRFLGTDGEYNIRRELCPFSMGPRTCPGQSIARRTIYTLLTKLITSFSIRPSTVEDVPSMDYIVGMTKQPKPFKIRFNPIV